MNFQRIASGIDVLPLLHAVTVTDRWNVDPVRTTFKDTCHAEVDDILIRFSPSRQLDEVVNGLSATWQPEASLYPQVRPLIFDLARRVEATNIGRVVITKLAPGKSIQEHADQGLYAEHYRRYHIVLQGLPGSQFFCGGDCVQMQTGEAWWFNHEQIHSVINYSAADRVHLIVDLNV